MFHMLLLPLVTKDKPRAKTASRGLAPIIDSNGFTVKITLLEAKHHAYFGYFRIDYGSEEERERLDDRMDRVDGVDV